MILGPYSMKGQAMKKILLTTGAIITATTLNAGTVIPVTITNYWNGNYGVDTNTKYSYEDNECQTQCYSWNGVIYETGDEPKTLAETAVMNGAVDPAAIVKYVNADSINGITVTEVSLAEYLENNAENIAGTGTIYIAVSGNYVGEDKAGNHHGGITFFNEVSVQTNTFEGRKYLWNDTLYDHPGDAAVDQVMKAHQDDVANSETPGYHSQLWTSVPVIKGVPTTPEENAVNNSNNKVVYEEEGYEFLNIADNTFGSANIADDIPTSHLAAKIEAEANKPTNTLTSAYIFQQVVNEFSELTLRGEVADEVLQLSKDVFVKGYDNGFEDGYNKGFNDGYSIGFVDGFNAGVNSITPN